MKHLKYLVLLSTLSIIFFSCEKVDPYNISGTYQLIIDVPKIVSKDKLPVTITAKNIADSRCPANGQCIWEGYASTEVLFKTNEEEDALKLCMGGCDVVKMLKKGSVVLNGITYDVQLKEIIEATNKRKAKAMVVLTKK